MLNLGPQINNLKKAVNKRLLKVEKRFRFVISALILAGVFLLSTSFYFDKAFLFIPILAALAYFLTYFSILEGIEKIEWFTLFFIPVLLTISSYLFYFLFPGRWLTRLPFITIYAVSIYAVLLCSNIFNVGVEKNLQLYRAAFSINFFYQTFIGFLIFNLLFVVRQNFLVNGLIAGGISFILSLHLFWSIKLNHYFEKETIFYALLIGLVSMQLAVVLSFVPLKSTIAALFMVAFYYSLSGLVYNFLDQRLFAETIREYLIVLIFVSVITLLSISW